ncbi:DUF6207 family protein [Streptomyces sp. NPDC060027]
MGIVRQINDAHVARPVLAVVEVAAADTEARQAATRTGRPPTRAVTS